MVSLPSTAALRFQPTKRPQVNNQKSKPKATSARPIVTPQASASQSNASLDSVINATRAPPKTSIADWTGDGDDDDVNGFYGGEKRQRGGRKKRKKNKEEAHVAQNWDDIYDPSRPNNYEEYKISDEKVLEVREWKDRLYAHRIAKQHSDSSDSEDGADSRPQMKSQCPLGPSNTFLLTPHRSICTSNVVCPASNPERSAPDF